MWLTPSSTARRSTARPVSGIAGRAIPAVSGQAHRAEAEPMDAEVAAEAEFVGRVSSACGRAVVGFHGGSPLEALFLIRRRLRFFQYNRRTLRLQVRPQGPGSGALLVTGEKETARGAQARLRSDAQRNRDDILAAAVRRVHEGRERVARRHREGCGRRHRDALPPLSDARGARSKPRTETRSRSSATRPPSSSRSTGPTLRSLASSIASSTTC